MKITAEILLVTVLAMTLVHSNLNLYSDHFAESKVSPNQVKKWEVLFDGKDLAKWRKASVDSVPSKGWVVENGTLSVLKGRKGGDIITRETYGDFELECEFKLNKGANSGIKYQVNSIQNAKTKKFSQMGIEYQIIDDKNHPEIMSDPDGVSSTGSAYLLYAPKGKKLLPAGEWNKVGIIVKGNHVEHWLNGVKIVEYTRGSQDFLEKVAATKFVDYPQYAKASGGHIMITDHGDQVYFKNIRIRKL
ncbi:3-keto-disaccharide hydrolase [Dyadobacter frigoris]|uniref:DUF1080 domain-containing protein n=1 Tax=Dyadobacter frigoris TaxID=2576211 RepID=A0A4U6CZX8_9BACT|nr:DUF1080 domain-containing protein [Dyadobacter frigoris]TKT87024.1 DUF1080 domain-containing protein [Dyadobacter frigoris]GLU52780.1 hypothetical protein Dfri01_22410 [Dyadobacter frigoris]